MKAGLVFLFVLLGAALVLAAPVEEGAQAEGVAAPATAESENGPSSGMRRDGRFFGWGWGGYGGYGGYGGWGYPYGGYGGWGYGPYGYWG